MMPEALERTPTGPAGTARVRIPPGSDIAGALVSAARSLGCTVTKEGPPGAVRVTCNGQSVLVPARDSASPGPRASAVPRLATLLSGAALSAVGPGPDHDERERDTATRLLLHRLLPDANAAPLAVGDRATAAADTIAAHCEKVLAPLPPARHPASAAGSRRRRPQVAEPPKFSASSAGRTREPATTSENAAEGQSAREEPGGELFPRPDPEADRELRTRIWEVNEAAAAWYRQQLTPQSWGYRYMTRERGFSQEALDAFEIGFAPQGWRNLVDHLRSLTDGSGVRLYSDELLVNAGLARSSSRGTLIDRQRDRVIFPVRDHAGHLAGFGGRRHPRSQAKDTPKYLNTPETVAFRKGEILYGLWQSRRALDRGSPPVILEGYTDVLATWCAGGYAPVASLGVAFNHGQATALGAAGRLQDAPVLIARDPDPAGRRAAVHDIDVLTPRHTLDARYVPLAEDPADTWRHHGGAALRAVLDAHVPAADLLTDTVLAQYEGRLPAGDFDTSGILACRGVAQILGPTADDAVTTLGPSGIRRQVARTALATGESWSDVYWEFMCEWFPEKKIQAEEAIEAFDTMPQDEWTEAWSWALPPTSIERRIAEGPPADLKPERLKEIAARDEWRDWQRRTRTSSSATRAPSREAGFQGPDPPPARSAASRRTSTQQVPARTSRAGAPRGPRPSGHARPHPR